MSPPVPEVTPSTASASAGSRSCSPHTAPSQPSPAAEHLHRLQSRTPAPRVAPAVAAPNHNSPHTARSARPHRQRSPSSPAPSLAIRPAIQRLQTHQQSRRRRIRGRSRRVLQWLPPRRQSAQTPLTLRRQLSIEKPAALLVIEPCHCAIGNRLRCLEVPQLTRRLPPIQRRVPKKHESSRIPATRRSAFAPSP